MSHIEGFGKCGPMHQSFSKSDEPLSLSDIQAGRARAILITTTTTSTIMDIITTDSFKQHVEIIMKEWHVPAWSIAIFDGDHVLSRGFGFASLEEKKPASNDTIYDWASTSKSITAAAVGKLIEDGHFTWQSVVSDLLPDDFVLSDSRTSEVTVEDILSHRTGIPRHDRSYLGVNATTPDTPQSITRRLRHLPASAPLRKRWQYNNMMFTVGSYLVEKTSGQSFKSFIQQHIFDKLNMSSSYLQPSTVVKAGQGHRRALPYIWHPNTQTHELVEAVDQPEGQGAGLIQSTVDDFARWVQAMMTKDPRLFGEAIYDELVTARKTEIPGTEEEDSELAPGVSNDEYALGWDTMLYRGNGYIAHDGGELGFRSRMLFLPEKQFGMVMAGTCAGASMLNIIVSKELVDHMLQIPENERTDWLENIRADERKMVQEDSEALGKIREELSGQAGSTPAPESSIPLTSYTGTYNHPGYGDFKIEIKDGSLFVDATDRGMPFSFTFEHVKDNRVFISAEQDREDETIYSKAEFDIDQSNKITRLGLSIESELAPELLWFDKVA